jgi:hypothetical protein
MLRYEHFTDNVLAGNSQHHLDLRVHCAKPERQDRQLHLRVLEGRPTRALSTALLGANKKGTLQPFYLFVELVSV